MYPLLQSCFHCLQYSLPDVGRLCNSSICEPLTGLTMRVVLAYQNGTLVVIVSPSTTNSSHCLMNEARCSNGKALGLSAPKNAAICLNWAVSWRWNFL